MALLRPAEAARLVGVDSASLYRAMRRGTLSYTVDAKGSRQIDAAELQRVFEALRTAEAVRTGEAAQQGARVAHVAARTLPHDESAPARTLTGDSETEETSDDSEVSHPVVNGEKGLYERLLGEKDARLAQLECDIADLRKRLDREAEGRQEDNRRAEEERRRIMALIEHRPQTAPPGDVIHMAPYPGPPQYDRTRRRWWRLWGG